jgi:hypothetical protein
MGSSDDLRSPGLVVDPWEGDVQLNCDVGAPRLGRDQAHMRIDGHLAELDALTPGHDAQGPLEAGCISDGEQLLGIGTTSVTSHLFGRSELHVQHPVARCAMAMVASTRDRRLGCVKPLGHADLLRSATSTPVPTL